MNIVDFVYRGIEKFAPMTSMQVSALESEARTWYSTKLNEDSMIGRFLKQYGEHVVTRTVLAIVFIFVSKSLLEYVNSNKQDDDEDDDD